MTRHGNRSIGLKKDYLDTQVIQQEKYYINSIIGNCWHAHVLFANR